MQQDDVEETHGRRLSRRVFLAGLGAGAAALAVQGPPDAARAAKGGSPKPTPTPTTAPTYGHPLPQGYLHTAGAQITASDGTPVRLAGVNWYGFECNSFVAGGLDHQTLDFICQKTVSLGFNVIRLPFSVQLVLQNPVVTSYLNANPSLQGLPALDIMGRVISTAGKYGLKVILDCHRSEAGWSWQSNGLWYSQTYTEDLYRQAWQQVTMRFASDPNATNPTVIGCDLRNEPAAPPKDSAAWPANGGSAWGFGDDNTTGYPRDWAAAAERTANQVILALNPNLLIFVEGVRGDPAGPYVNGQKYLYWPGGSLVGVGKAGGARPAPRLISLNVPNRLVYSAHDYGPDAYSALAWCQLNSTANTPDACYSVWDQAWGFIAKGWTDANGVFHQHPVLLGEFGTVNGYKPNDDTPKQYYTDINSSNAQGNWFTYLVQYMKDNGIHWTYWALNGSQSLAPGRDPSTADWYGVLKPDWSDYASAPLMNKLHSIQ